MTATAAPTIYPPDGPQDTKQQKAILRQRSAARRARALFPANTRVESTSGAGGEGRGVFGTVKRHVPGSNAQGGTVIVVWDNGSEGRHSAGSLRVVDDSPTAAPNRTLAQVEADIEKASRRMSDLLGRGLPREATPVRNLRDRIADLNAERATLSRSERSSIELDVIKAAEDYAKSTNIYSAGSMLQNIEQGRDPFDLADAPGRGDYYAAREKAREAGIDMAQLKQQVAERLRGILEQRQGKASQQAEQERRDREKDLSRSPDRLARFGRDMETVPSSELVVGVVVEFPDGQPRVVTLVHPPKRYTNDVEFSYRDPDTGAESATSWGSSIRRVKHKRGGEQRG